jgi:hypothetical protein
MRKTSVWITVCSCLIISTVASAQATRKPGLWEMTSTMTWQKSPMPAGMSMPAGGSSPFGGGPHTSQVCLTQAMIDKYGAPPPQSRNNQCTMSNVVMKGNGMTGDWICSGMMAGKGTVEASWTDSDHAISKVHFLGSMQMGPNATPIEYTIESSSVFKGSDCGNVKPIQMPDK